MNLTLASAVQVDALSYNVMVTPSSGAPAATGVSLSDGLTAYDQNNGASKSTAANNVSIVWQGLSPVIMGSITVATGTFKFTIPTAAVGGQSYVVNWGATPPSAQCCGLGGTSVNPSEGAAQTVTVPTVLTITTASPLPPATAGKAYTKTITTSGGTGPFTFSLGAGWPAGFTIGSTTGVITGTPASAASLTNLPVSVTDSSSPTKETANASYSLTVNAALGTITPATLPAGTVNTAYSQNVSVTGGTSPYTWSATGLPTGLSITGTTATATISGTVTTPVAGASVTVTVTDTNGATKNIVYSLTIHGPLTLSPASGSALPTGTMSFAYTTGSTVAAGGGTPPYAFSVNSGTLPGGLAISSTTGVISGTPTANGAFPGIQVTVTDSASSSVTNTYSLQVNPALVLTSPASIPGGTQGAPYPGGITFSATGGSGSYTWAISGLAGVTIPGTGASVTLGGTPSTPGAFTVTITVTDANYNTVQVTKTYTNVVIAVGVTINTPANNANLGATVSTAFSQAIVSTGGTGPFTWLGTSLPAGLSLGSSTTNNNSITGTPTGVGGPTAATVKVTDNTGSISQVTYNITVYALPVVGGGPVPIATVSSAYTSGSTITLTGGAPPIAWTATGLPAGLSVSPTTGVITGTPTTNAASPYTVAVTATDANKAASSMNFTLTVHPAITITPNTASLAVGIPSVKYTSVQFVAGGGSGSGYTFAATGLPTGLTMSGAGLLSGTPSATSNAGSPYNVAVTVTDGIGAQATFHYNLPVAPPLSISGPSTLPAGTANVAYVTGTPSTVTATGGTPPYSWSATGLPPGMSINAASGQISGSPTSVAGSPYSVTVTVTDVNSTTATKTYSITVAALPLRIVTGLLPNGILNIPYPATSISAQGGVQPYAWTVTGLPPGLTTDGNGDIGGTPTSTTGSPFSVTVTLSDATLTKVTRVYIVTISGTLSVAAPATLPSAAINTPYATTIMAGGGAAPYTWAATGLPAGLSINIATGVISGSPTTGTGSPFSVVVTVTDSTGKTASMTYSLVVNATALTISGPATLPQGIVGTAYTPTTVTATGGNGSFTWSATGLPSGLTIGTGTGAISGTPAAGSAGAYSVVVTVKDATSDVATMTYPLTVIAATTLPVITSVSTVAGGQAAITPNTYVGIYGSNFAAAGFTDTWSNTVVNGVLPTKLDNISVMIGATAAYVEYVSATQINVLVPNVGFGQMSVTVTTPAGTSSSFTVTSTQLVPEFFPWPNNQPVATHLDYSYAVANGTFSGVTTVPAAPGETIVLWGQGFGATTPIYPFGVAIPTTPIYSTSNAVSVTLNNGPITVVGGVGYLASGFAGVYQVAVTIPTTIANGSYSITTTVNGVTSPPLMLTVAAPAH